jgi:dTDP-4-amino-4,6-dideoxygalactose transaminase
MSIPLVDLQTQYRRIRGEIAEAVQQVLDTSSYVLGPAVAEFEPTFAAYCGTKHCVGVASGGDALEMALRAVGVGAGDEVITAANTFIATAMAISAVGAVPVLVDHDPRTYNIDVSRIAAVASPRTRAIIPVHLYGRPADMDPILELARARGWWVIEDACQAHGARYRGRRCGGLGDAAAFSFYPGKNLGAYGDGGAVTTSDDGIAQRVRQLRDWGSVRKYEHEIVGCNSRLDSIQAAVLNVKLRHLDEWNERRRRIAAVYSTELDREHVVAPACAADVEPVHHLYVIRVARRDELLAFLKEHGVFAGIHYPVPIHRQRAYADAPLRTGSLPNAEAFAPMLLSLPIYPELEEDQTRHVARLVNEFVARTAPDKTAHRPELTPLPV